MALKPLDGYPVSIGSSKLSIFPHAGPTSYVQAVYTTGSALTGADPVQAIEAGLKYFDAISDATTDDGSFRIVAVPAVQSSTPGGASATTYILIWVANRTGTMGGQTQTAGIEAAAGSNLSTFIVRLTAIGPK